MKIDLPLETWTDIFGFLPRTQLVEFSPHIHDRQFASFIQFFLHKCGQITLGKLHITSSPNANGPIVVQNNRELPLAEMPIPSNVVNFEEIRLSHFDSSVLGFMQELQRNSLLENVTLIFEDCFDDLMTFLDTILPLIANIDSIKLVGRALCPSVFFKLGKAMLKSTRVFETWDRQSNDWYCEWLCSPREDGKPRVLFVYKCGFRSRSFIEHIKKGFFGIQTGHQLLHPPLCSLYTRCSNGIAK